MTIPFEAFDGISENSDRKANNGHDESRTESSVREKRQYLYKNNGFGYPAYGRLAAVPNYYPRYHNYDQYDKDENKPRVAVHVETEKKNKISRITTDSQKTKRQLFGLTSLVSPIQALESPIQVHLPQDKLKQKSEVPNQRKVREVNVPIEVPIRAEEHHGVVTIKSKITGEPDRKKSTIERINKREADDRNHAQSPVKRQFVYNSEPEIVRATVNGEHAGTPIRRNPIGNLIKLIAGHNAKNILGLNSKSFDVFPGPLPAGGERSMWNMKSGEARGAAVDPDRNVPFAPPQQPEQVEDMYSRAGLVMDGIGQRRAEAAKEASREESERQALAEKEAMAAKEAIAAKEAVAAKEAMAAKEAATIASQAQAAAQEQRAEEEKMVEREREDEREQEFEHEKAREIALIAASQQQQQLEDQTQDAGPIERIQRPIGAFSTPEVDDRQPALAAMVPRDNYMPSNEDSDIGQQEMPSPLAPYGYEREQAYAPMQMMRPTAAAFLPTPTMFMLPRYPFVPFPAPTAPMMHRPLVAHAGEEIADQHYQHFQPHYQHHYQPRYQQQPHSQEHYQPHYQTHHHTPTQPPYHLDDAGYPDEDEDDEKPEVHVHIQTEKSDIPKSVAQNKDKIAKNLGKVKTRS